MMGVVSSELRVSMADTGVLEAGAIKRAVETEEKFHPRLIEWGREELGVRRARVAEIMRQFEAIAGTKAEGGVAFSVHSLEKDLANQELLVAKLGRAAKALRRDEDLIDLVRTAGGYGDVYVGGGVVAAGEAEKKNLSDVDMLVDLDEKKFAKLAKSCRRWTKEKMYRCEADGESRLRFYDQDGRELYMIASVLPMARAAYTIAMLSGRGVGYEARSNMDYFVAYWAGYESEQMLLRFRRDERAPDGLATAVVGIDGMVGNTYYGVRNPMGLIYTNYEVIERLREKGFEKAAKFVEERYFKDMVNLVKNWRRGRWMLGSSMLFDGVSSAKMALGELAAGGRRVPEWFGERLAENLDQALGAEGVAGVMVGLTEFPLVVVYSPTLYQELGFRTHRLGFVERIEPSSPYLERAMAFRELVLGDGGLYGRDRCRDLSEFFAVMSFFCQSEEAIYKVGEELAANLPKNVMAFDQVKFNELALFLHRSTVPVRKSLADLRLEGGQWRDPWEEERLGKKAREAVEASVGETRQSPEWKKYHVR